VTSAINITHEPLRNITYSDAYKATYHIVGREHPSLSLTKWNTESFGHRQSFLRNTTNISFFLRTTMQDQDWKESMMAGAKGEDEDASLDE
jgi:hypothetical protein